MEGEVTINDVIIDEVPGSLTNTLQFSVIPESNDLVSLRETYLTIGIDNLVVNVIDDEISSGANVAGTGVVPESNIVDKKCRLSSLLGEYPLG